MEFKVGQLIKARAFLRLGGRCIDKGDTGIITKRAPSAHARGISKYRVSWLIKRPISADLWWNRAVLVPIEDGDNGV